MGAVLTGCDLPDRWWRDKDTLQAEHDKHGSLDNIAAAHEPSAKTLREWWRKHGLPPHRPGPKTGAFRPRASRSSEEVDEGWLLEALRQLGDSATVEDIANLADVAPRRVREAYEQLAHAGYRLTAPSTGEVRLERTPRETGNTTKARPELFDGDDIRFAVVSDVHLGSVAERLDELHTAYDIIQNETSIVYHVGDLVDGLGIYKGQVSEITHHTFEAQRDHAIEVYPVRDGVHTQIISGNHDLEGDLGRVGADAVQAVCNVRSDMEYLGQYSATVELPNGGSLQMLHPMGGPSYALSYKPQKIVEGYDLGSKPSVLLIGHWHRAGYFPIRGVQTLLAGTFQGPTSYSVRKAFGAPGFGFWLVTARMADDGSLVRFRPEWMPFYPGRTI